MNVAFEMFFDPETDAAVRALWCKLKALDLPSTRAEAGWIPHISLTVFNELDLAMAEARLAAFAAEQESIEVRFSSIGAFPTEEGVLFLAPVVTERLLRLHAAFHTLFEDTRSQQWAYYFPGSWVPHTTLAFIRDEAVFAEALGLIKAAFSPLTGRIRSVGIVQYPEVKVLSRFNFKP